MRQLGSVAADADVGVPAQARRLPDPVIAAIFGIALMLLVSRLSGQDYNWDLLNYHYASPQLLLSGRDAVHVAPSGLQSWFNPIGYVPAYLAITFLSPAFASALLAIVSGLNAPLIYLIASSVGAGLPRNVRVAASYTCVAIGMSGAIMFSEAGTTFLDSALSIAILGALYCVVLALGADRMRACRLIACAGLLTGATCGLKLTNVPIAIGMAGAVIAATAVRRLPPVAIAALALGGLLGFAVSGGWWAWRMWTMFGNPVFPMFNQVFRSPFAPAVAVIDATFLPRDWTGIVVYPWHWLIGDTTPGTELPIVDRRYPLALVAALLIALSAWAHRTQQDAWRAPALVIAIFVLVTYLVWLFAFAILRYFVIVELLSGVAMLAALRLVLESRPRRIPAVLIAAACVLSLTTTHGSWGRGAFTADWFDAKGLSGLHRPGTVYVLPGDTPLGFLIHSFPDDARFVRVGGTLPLTVHDRLGAKARDMIRDAPFVRSLAESPTSADGIATLRRFGLAMGSGPCRLITTKTGTIESCPLIRKGA